MKIFNKKLYFAMILASSFGGEIECSQNKKPTGVVTQVPTFTENCSANFYNYLFAGMTLAGSSRVAGSTSAQRILLVVIASRIGSRIDRHVDTMSQADKVIVKK